jgi:hypothetical protein
MRKPLLIGAAMSLGIAIASADIIPYSWQRFDQVRQSAGADSSGNNHPIGGGFTGNGEAPAGQMPVVNNVCVGGPLGPEGYLSTFSTRSRANQFNNQGVSFEEPNPQNTATLTNASLWGNFFQTNVNWVVECWCLPSRNGAANTATPIFATGLNRNNRSIGRQSGVALMCINGTNGTQNATGANVNGVPENTGNVYLRMQAVCPANAVDTNGNTMDFYIGPPVLVKTATNAEWMHVAVVRDDAAGLITWYTNGVEVAHTNAWRVYTTNYYSSVGFAGIQDSGLGDNFGPGLGGAAQPYEGYIAELRWSYFLPGTFSTTNLLTRRASAGSSTIWRGPVVVKDPQNVSVWQGAGAFFGCVAGTDTTLQYQWQRFSGSFTNITDATNRVYNFENASAGDNGAQFRCILTKPSNSLSTTSAVATLTVQANNPSFVTGYSNAIMAESSLVAYFPMDGTGPTLQNVKDPTHNGSISNAPFMFRNGNTNLAAGNQGLSMNLPNFEYTGGYNLKTNENGYAIIPGDNPAFNFVTASAGNGTVEAVLYADPSMANVLLTGGSSELCVWLSSASVYNAAGGNTKPAFDYYTFGVDGFGALHYRNSSGSGFDLVWTVPGGMFGKRRHVAFVFSNTTNVTCYVDGANLGTKFQPGFGNTLPSATQPLTIGKGGGALADLHGYWRDSWRGSVDELAIYGSALSSGQVQQHVFRLNSGTNNSAASIVNITPSKSLFTGFPVQVLGVTAGGNPPFTYQWRSNNVNLAGATNSTYSFSGSGVPAGVYPFSVVLQGSIGGSVTSAPINLTVLNPSGYAAKVYASSQGGPKAFYPLTENTGTNILDWAGTHDGVVAGSYALSIGNDGPAAGTGALRMFGSNVVNSGVITPSAVTIPYYPELNPENGGNFSQEFWYNPDDTNVTICAVSAQANLGNAKAGMSTLCGVGRDGVGQTTIQYWTMMYGKYNNLNQGVAQNSSEGVTPPVAGQWQHIVSVADGNDALVTVYVNGTADYVQNVSYSVYPGDGSVTGGANQNYYAPYTLGNYNGTYAWPMKGRLSQVAIYDYALSYSDVTNHTSQIWTQAVITVQPIGLTNIESLGTATLTAKAIGVPLSYQWYKDGSPLSPVLNLDGTAHFPQLANIAGVSQGVDGPKLVISQPRTNDSGAYQLRVTNPLNAGGFTNTVSVNVLFTNDTTLPIITNVSARGLMVSGPVIDEATGSSGNPTLAPVSIVEVKFSKRVDPVSAMNPANYIISGGVSVTNVVLANSVADTKFGGDYRAVGLVTTGLTPGANYTVTVANVFDQASFANKLATTNRAFLAPSLTANLAQWNYYYQITGGFIGLGSQTNAAFPYVPQFSGALTNFSSDAIAYNFSLGNNSFFSGEVDNYAASVTAFISPTNTGYYEFFINGDDKARLYLNPIGTDPAGAMWIGDSSQGGAAFSDVYAVPNHFLLTAGQKYFLQIIQVETSGNDNCRAGWRYLGTVDQGYDGTGANGAWIVDATNLPPIEGKFLTAYGFAAPSIITQPQSVVAAAGTTTNLLVVVSANGSGITNYQWRLNGAAASGKTAAINSFAPVAFANYGNWDVQVSDGYTTLNSSVVTVVPPAPSIVTPPAGKAVPRGLAGSLTVTPLTFSGVTNYQWMLGTTNVSGANYTGITNGTLGITSMQPTNAGPYKVVVSDGFTTPALTSAVATVTIALNPTLTQSRSGTNLIIGVPTEVGPNYVTEFKNLLTDPTWTPLVTNAGTGGSISVTNTVTTPTQRFFRTRMQ